MRNLFLILSILLFANCESNGVNQHCDIINTVTANLVNPEFINIQVPGGWSYANGSVKGLIIYNSGSFFKAFSRECPKRDCSNKLTVKNDIKMVCPCDDSEYSILDGSPQTAGFTESVCEFKVVEVNTTVINITNY